MQGAIRGVCCQPPLGASSLALACDSGIGTIETCCWLKAVKVLLDSNMPCCFTSYQMTEGEGEGVRCLSRPALMSLVLVQGVCVCVDAAPPSLALACDSGIGGHETGGWLKAVRVLLDSNMPCCFTSYQMTEGKGEGVRCLSRHMHCCPWC
jgi:hypothetical protein